MRPRDLHRWDVTPKEGVAIQRELRERLVLRDDLDQIRLVAGADIALDKKEKLGFGGVVVFPVPDHGFHG